MTTPAPFLCRYNHKAGNCTTIYRSFNSLRVLIFVLIPCLLASGAYAGSITVQLPSIGSDTICGDFTTSHQSAKRHVIDRFDLPGFESNTVPGNPALPCKLIYVALPPDADCESITIDDSSQSVRVLPDVYDVGPVPPIAPLDAAVSGERPRRNLLVYKQDAFYPRNHVILRGIGNLRTWKIAMLEFWPYCYNPASGKLRLLTSQQVQLNFSTSPSPRATISDSVASKLAALVINRGQAQAWYNSPMETESVCYAIITTKQIATSSRELPAFVELQQLRGFNVKIATEDDWGGGTGDVAAANIRNWLADNYLKLGIQYVLFIGDPSPFTGDVPMKMLWPRYNQPSYREAPSDYFYADLTGNWDRDGDGVFGEEPDDFGPGGIDRVPDVCVGRIPFYGSIEDLDRILRKTIDYHSTTLGDWGRRFILPIKVLDPYTPGYQLGERIARNVALPAGLTPVRLYDASFGLNPPPEHVPCDYASVQQEWQNGAGFVFWMTHGGVTAANDVIDVDRCRQLDDFRPAIVYQGSCSNGMPEHPKNLAYSLLCNGAITTVAASRSAWYYIGETDFTGSDSVGGMAYQYALYLLEHKQDCARALVDARLSVPAYIWMNHLVLNLYGDPSVAYNRPASGAISGRITTVSGNPIPNALISLADGTASTISDVDGRYTLSNMVPGYYDIRVSASGFYSQRFYAVPVCSGKRTTLDALLIGTTPGSISGRVCDVFGSPISDAAVMVLEEERETVSSISGTYRLDGLPPGTYTIVASKFPFAQEMVSDCVVRGGAITEIDIVLRSRTGNAVRNGGFEQKSADGSALYWSSYSTPGVLGALAVSSDYRKYGAHAQRITLPPSDSDTGAGICQTVNVVPGTEYSLIAWQRDNYDEKNNPPKSMICRIGYDPTGGSDGKSLAIIWHEFQRGHNTWHSVFAKIVPYAPTMTIFLDARCGHASSDSGEWVVWFDGVSLIGAVAPPSVPLVKVPSRYQSDTSSITAEWSCPDVDVASFEYAVSCSSDQSGILPGGEWQNVGTATSATRTGLILPNGSKIRVLVRSRSESGVLSETGVSPPVRIVRDLSDLASLRQLPDGVWVRITNLKVTRMGYGPECFLWDSNRIVGIKAVGDWASIPYLKPGTVTTVVGCLRSDGPLRVIENAEVFPSIGAEVPRSLGMLSRSVSCSTEFGGSGLCNCGLLVTVVGRVTEGSSDSFVLWDGSLANGLRVSCFNSAIPPPEGSVVRVTGIVVPGGLAVYDHEDIVYIPDSQHERVFNHATQGSGFGKASVLKR